MCHIVKVKFIMKSFHVVFIKYGIVPSCNIWFWNSLAWQHYFCSISNFALKWTGLLDTICLQVCEGSRDLLSVCWLLSGVWCKDWTWVWLVSLQLCLYAVCCWYADDTNTECDTDVMSWQTPFTDSITAFNAVMNFSFQIKTQFALQIICQKHL